MAELNNLGWQLRESINLMHLGSSRRSRSLSEMRKSANSPLSSVTSLFTVSVKCDVSKIDHESTLKKLLSYQFEILPELFNTVGLLSLIPTSPQVDDVVECGTIKKIKSST